jgi:hypothetical protein
VGEAEFDWGEKTSAESYAPWFFHFGRQFRFAMQAEAAPLVQRVGHGVLRNVPERSRVRLRRPVPFLPGEILFIEQREAGGSTTLRQVVGWEEVAPFVRRPILV